MANEKRLIDAMDTVTKISKKVTPQIEQGCHPQRVYAEVLSCIADAPTVDAVEVVRGRWIMETDMDEDWGEMDYYKCSVCNKCQFGETNYCPHCGAKMKGERKDNES